MKRLEVAPTPEAVADSIANDTAGRNDELVDIVKLIESIEGPYSLLLDAPWGDGKTFFVRSLEEVLKTLNPHIATTMENEQKLARVTKKLEDIETPYLPFYFNAWEHDFADDPISALFATMAVAFEAENLTKAHSARKAITSIVDAALATLPISARVSGVVEALEGESLIEAYNKRAKLRELIDDLAENCIAEVANKLIIIIDELDRCRPDFAVRLLGQTKSLFQSENIIVVISADSHQLAHATAGLYGPGYDSQRFIERFYDQRLQLSPSDPYKVVEGNSLSPSTHFYSLMVASLLRAHDLTIRDYQRIHDELAAGENYCAQHDDGSIVTSIAKCFLVPLLIFLKRDDYAAFRRVTSGQDHDALYTLGSKHAVFIEGLSHCSGAPGWPRSVDENNQAVSESPEEFVRDICVWLYADVSSDEYREAAGRLRTAPYGFNKTVLRTLRFPLACMPD